MIRGTAYSAHEQDDKCIYRASVGKHQERDYLEDKHRTNKLRGFSLQSELYRPSDRRLSAKLVLTLVDRGCRVVSATNPHGR
jgi:hypothetical protein